MDQPVDNVRERILVEATHLFAERGVAGTSIQAVAQAAGITRPTLVYHFGSKAGLRNAVLAAVMDHWRDELPRLMTAASGKGPRLDGLITAVFDFFRRDPTRARVLVREMLDRPDDMQALLREHLQPLTGLLTQAIRLGQATGALQAGVNPEAYTVLVITSALGLVAVGPHSAALVAPSPDLDALQAELIRSASAALISSRKEHS